MASVIDVTPGHVFIDQLCKALGVEAGLTARIVIDVRADEVVHVFVETIGTKKLLELDWTALLDGEPGVVRGAEPAPVVPPYDGPGPRGKLC
jgi:hypothetical protein